MFVLTRMIGVSCCYCVDETQLQFALSAFDVLKEVFHLFQVYDRFLGSDLDL